MINDELLKILACPQCKGPLKYDNVSDAILCGECVLSYPIRDGIPILLVEEAQKIKETTK